MKINVRNLSNEVVGDINLNDSVFGLPARPDILARVVRWQLAKRQQGTHSTKTIAYVSGTTRKPFRQKGTGNARQGSLRSVHMRGGGVAHGPNPHSHEVGLQKKVRKLGLKHALSAKHSSGKLLILNSSAIDAPKTSVVSKGFARFGEGSFFVVDGNEVNTNFAKATANLMNVVCVPQIGANVYDIIKHDYLILTESGLKALGERLKNA